MQRTLVPRDSASVRVLELWLIPSKAWSLCPPSGPTSAPWYPRFQDPSVDTQPISLCPFRSSYRRRGIKEAQNHAAFCTSSPADFAPCVEFGLWYPQLWKKQKNKISRLTFSNTLNSNCVVCVCSDCILRRKKRKKLNSTHCNNRVWQMLNLIKTWMIYQSKHNKRRSTRWKTDSCEKEMRHW